MLRHRPRSRPVRPDRRPYQEPVRGCRPPRGFQRFEGLQGGLPGFLVIGDKYAVCGDPCVAHLLSRNDRPLAGGLLFAVAGNEVGIGGGVRLAGVDRPICRLRDGRLGRLPRTLADCADDEGAGQNRASQYRGRYPVITGASATSPVRSVVVPPCLPDGGNSERQADYKCECRSQLPHNSRISISPFGVNVSIFMPMYFNTHRPSVLSSMRTEVSTNFGHRVWKRSLSMAS